MGVNDRMIFSTPPAAAMVVEKVPVEGISCPKCGSDDIRRYPVGWVFGPRMTVKCQVCYYALSNDKPELEDNWPPFRTLTYDWEASLAERPTPEAEKR
jgi:ssDNA-binding Zn-finger/Zn-ribbon topoisomerase 1